MRHSEFFNAMLELERAINKAHKIAETEFYSMIYKNECNDLSEIWYKNMKGLEAMTQIKCMIDAG